MINCALKIKFPFIQTKSELVLILFICFLSRFAVLFQHFFVASFHLNQPLHEAKKNKRYICIACRGTYVFVFSPINEIFLKTKQKNDEKQNAYFCSIFFICKNYLVLWMASLESIIMCFSFSIENSKPRSKITNKWMEIFRPNYSNLISYISLVVILLWGLDYCQSRLKTSLVTCVFRQLQVFLCCGWYVLVSPSLWKTTCGEYLINSKREAFIKKGLENRKNLNRKNLNWIRFCISDEIPSLEQCWI